MTLSTAITLNGACGDVFLFRIGAAFDVAASAEILLTGGLSAANIFWVVDGSVTIGASSIFYGTILGGSSIAIGAAVSYVGSSFSCFTKF